MLGDLSVSDIVLGKEGVLLRTSMMGVISLLSNIMVGVVDTLVWSSLITFSLFTCIVVGMVDTLVWSSLRIFSLFSCFAVGDALVWSSLMGVLSFLSNLSTRERVLPRTTATAKSRMWNIKFQVALILYETKFYELCQTSIDIFNWTNLFSARRGFNSWNILKNILIMNDITLNMITCYISFFTKVDTYVFFGTIICILHYIELQEHLHRDFFFF